MQTTHPLSFALCLFHFLSVAFNLDHKRTELSVSVPTVSPPEAVCSDFKVKYNWNEGPMWLPSEHAFLFTNFVVGGGPGDILKYTPSTGVCEIFIKDAGCNGLSQSLDGDVLAGCQSNRALMKFNVTTKQGTVIADNVNGKQLDTPNDVVADSKGNIYFTNNMNELGNRTKGLGNALLRRDPLGQVSVIRYGYCNGIELSPDEQNLYVVAMGVFDLDQGGNVVSHIYPDFPLSIDGLSTDKLGNIYTAEGFIVSPSGHTVSHWSGGTNACFGGDDGHTLFFVEKREIYTSYVSIPGRKF